MNNKEKSNIGRLFLVKNMLDVIQKDGKTISDRGMKNQGVRKMIIIEESADFFYCLNVTPSKDNTKCDGQYFVLNEEDQREIYSMARDTSYIDLSQIYILNNTKNSRVVGKPLSYMDELVEKYSSVEDIIEYNPMNIAKTVELINMPLDIIKNIKLETRDVLNEEFGISYDEVLDKAIEREFLTPFKSEKVVEGDSFVLPNHVYRNLDRIERWTEAIASGEYEGLNMDKDTTLNDTPAIKYVCELGE